MHCSLYFWKEKLCFKERSAIYILRIIFHVKSQNCRSNFRVQSLNKVSFVCFAFSRSILEQKHRLHCFQLLSVVSKGFLPFFESSHLLSWKLLFSDCWQLFLKIFRRSRAKKVNKLSFKIWDHFITDFMYNNFNKNKWIIFENDRK